MAEEKKGLLKRLFGGNKPPEQSGEPKLQEFDMNRAEDREMAESEQILADRQTLDYQERSARIPEREEENVAKLFQVESRLAMNKNLLSVRDPVTSIERKIGIESSDEYPEPFNEDLTKADLNNTEIKSCWGHITLINALRDTGKSTEFPFQAAAQFFNGQKNAIINISRGRSGFSAILSRTNKSVSEGLIQHMKREAQSKQENKWRLF